jgi:hypothetical protein
MNNYLKQWSMSPEGKEGRILYNNNSDGHCEMCLVIEETTPDTG